VHDVSARVVVTGACGFIGWKVTELLLEQGWTVLGLDDVNDAYDVRLKQWRLAELEARGGFEFHRVDIGNREALSAFFRAATRTDSAGIAAVVNLAARAGVRTSVANPWVYVATNMTGNLNLLDLCREFRIGKFVLASTSSLYGSNNPRPFREDADTNLPLSPYAASKKAAEAMSYTYHYLHGLDVTVLRFFTVYGPAGRPDMSLFRFVQWISEDRDVIVFGDGNQERDFTYVDDIARGVVSALKPVGFEVVNLGSDEPVVLNDAIALIERLVGRSARIQRRPLHPADVAKTWADITKAGAILGWRPETSFESGVKNLVQWYRSHRGWAKGIDTA